MLFEYIKIFIFLVISYLIVTFLIFLSLTLNKKNYYPNAPKPVECGSHSFGSGRNRVEINFIVVSILFVIFEIELMVLIPWIYFYKITFFYHSEIYVLAFLAQLVLGLAFEATRRVISFKKK